MTRDGMIALLHTLPFALIDPASEWKDIGFTERPIWVNAKGYGWISCDEPIAWCTVPGIPIDQWQSIRSKIANGSLVAKDIENTSLWELLNEITYGEFDEDFDDLCDLLEDLTKLPEHQIDSIYAMDTFDGWQFFATEEDFNEAYERDWCDVAWDDLSDVALSEWIDRLTDEGLLCGEFIASCSADDLIIDFQGFVQSLDTAYLTCSIEPAEFDAYFQESCEQLNEFLLDEQTDAFYDKLDSTYPKGTANGNPSYYKAYDQFIDAAKANIQRRYGNSHVQLIAKDACGFVKGCYSISVSDLFLKVLESNTECGEFDGTIGQYIESSLMKFLELSNWHFGYRNQNGIVCEIRNVAEYNAVSEKSCPILWFGPDGEAPIDRWSIVIGKEHGFKWIDQWYLLEYLIDDCTDCFATWYLAECGYFLPDMEAILAECPIQISESETVDTLNSKILAYFSTKY